MTTTIVVTGTRTRLNSYEVFGARTLAPTEPNPVAFDGSTLDSNPEGVSVSIAVQVSDASKADAAATAAQNVADALLKIVIGAQALPPSTAIPLPGGGSITAANLLTEIQNTHFVVTDQQLQGVNLGVGSADYLTHTDTLDYTAFDGPLSYAAPGYIDGQGMVGIMLHELGHMSSQGYSNWLSEVSMFHREVGELKEVGATFNGSAYFYDNEAWADDFASSAATAMGLDIHQYNDASPYTGTYQGAAEILMDHGGWA